MTVSYAGWNDGHTVARNVEIDKYTKNKFVHQVGFIYKITVWIAYH